MVIRHYGGELGAFDYDDEEFKLASITEESEKISKTVIEQNKIDQAARDAWSNGIGDMDKEPDSKFKQRLAEKKSQMSTKAKINMMLQKGEAMECAAGAFDSGIGLGG